MEANTRQPELGAITEHPEERVGGWARTVTTESQWQGVETKYHFQDDSFIVEKSYDADPILKQAAADRMQTEGEDYGDLAKLGTIPFAVISEFAQKGLYIGTQEFADAAYQWLMKNPAMISHAKAAKAHFADKKIYVPPGVRSA